MRPWEKDKLGTWEYAEPGYGWFRQSHRQTAEQFRSWLDKHPEYVTMAPPDKEVSLGRWYVVRQRALGGYLYQKRKGSSEEQGVLYFLRSCSKDECKWDTRELELLAAIATLEHMQYYIDGQRVTLETDHNNLRWIMNIKNSQGKLARWITRLSCYLLRRTLCIS